MAEMTKEQVEHWRKIMHSHWAADKDGVWLTHEESHRQSDAMADLALDGLRLREILDKGPNATVRTFNLAASPKDRAVWHNQVIPVISPDRFTVDTPLYAIPQGTHTAAVAQNGEEGAPSATTASAGES